MKKIFLLVLISALLFLTSCPMDYGCAFPIVNRSDDTVYVCSASYNDIDSVKHGLGSRRLDESLLDDVGKIIVYNNDIILPDSIRYYIERGHYKNIFHFNEDKKGYFFIIKLETIKNYTWEEIRKNKLYEELIVTREMLEENNWNIDYYSKEDKK